MSQAQAIPSHDIQKTGRVSQMYQEKMFKIDLYNKLAESEADVAAGRTQNAKAALQQLREKYNV